jgi:hypothetical protein
MALQAMAKAARAFPGGLAFLWDAPFEWLGGLSSESRRAFFGMLALMPGLELHLREEGFAEWLDGPIPAWLHAPEAPTGRLGQLWRQGWFGWVPETGQGWSLPGFGLAMPASADAVSGLCLDTAWGSKGGPRDRREQAVPPFRAEEEPLSGSLWGELVLPVGALGEVGPEEVAGLMADVQAKLEWDFSLRLASGAWPEAFPFQRRRAGWRVALLGGREFELRGTLRCPVWAGSCHEFELASRLGHQAMREGLPWRASLPMPPLAPLFSPGFAADPREPASLEGRARFPAPLSGLLSHPPLALLRVPGPPQEGSVAAFLRGMAEPSAIRWIPPEIPPPGPFSAERPWPQAGAFPPMMDVTQALQPGLFDEME